MENDSKSPRRVTMREASSPNFRRLFFLLFQIFFFFFLPFHPKSQVLPREEMIRVVFEPGGGSVPSPVCSGT